MRVTQRTMFNTYVHNMNSTLSAYMESNIQGSSQKKINRPSDDPAGMALVLNTRNDISRSTQYEKNADTAQGWIDLGQQTLGSSVSTTITKIKELAIQASNGTYLAENREQIATQLREYMGTLVNLANTKFGDKSIFAGHKYDESAFDETLAASTQDPALADAKFEVSGKTDSTHLIQFTSGGDLDPTAGAAPITYRWTDDGGDTWTDGVYTPSAAPTNLIQMDGVTLTMPTTGTVTTYVPAVAGEPSTPSSGTSIMVRPSAIYNGDNNDRPPDTINAGGPAGMTSTASGTYQNDVIVRFDEDVNLATPGTVNYSYSEDNGSTWIKATTEATGIADPVTGEFNVRLTVPGGYTDVNVAAANTTIDDKTQVIIHPNRANLGYEIMEDTYISVNSVGKDIFGGLYGDPPSAVEGLSGNLFETVGQLIGFAETNNAEGIADTLDAITASHEQILTATARLGGLDNRISLAQDVLSFQKLNKAERLSYTEDVDLTQLLTTMAQQQLAYNTVLQSSSMIMNMGLVNFI